MAGSDRSTPSSGNGVDHVTVVKPALTNTVSHTATDSSAVQECDDRSIERPVSVTDNTVNNIVTDSNSSNTVTDSTSRNTVANSTSSNIVTDSISSNTVANSTSRNTVANSTSSNTMTDSTSSNTVTHSTSSNIVTDSISSNTVANSTSSITVTHSTSSNIVTDSISSNTVANSTSSITVTDSTSSNTMTDSTSSNTVTHSTSSNIVTDSTSSNTMTDSTSSNTVTHSTSSNTMTDSTSSNTVTHSTRSNIVTDSTSSNTVTDSTSSNTVANITSTSTSSSSSTSTSSSSSTSTSSSSSTSTSSSDVSCRVWIGNLDLRVCELGLLRLLRACGQLTGFDLPLHRNGPLSGRPRGFAFASFASRHEALRAITRLDGHLMGERYLRTRWALHNEHASPESGMPAPPGDKPGKRQQLPEVDEEEASDQSRDENHEEAGMLHLSSTDAKIRAIENALAACSERGGSEPFPAGRGTTSPGSLPRIRPVVSYINAANRPPGANQRCQRKPRDKFRPPPRRPHRRR